jgi:hypothetical protein
MKKLLLRGIFLSIFGFLLFIALGQHYETRQYYTRTGHFYNELAACAPAKATSPLPRATVAFGDSWLELSQLDAEKHVVYSASFQEIKYLINSHRGGDYKTVIILGGIVEPFFNKLSLDECAERQEAIRKRAHQKFPNASIIVIPMKHMLETLAIYDLDGAHITLDGYPYLFDKYDVKEPGSWSSPALSP